MTAPATTVHPFATCRVQIEDQVRQIADPLPDHAACGLYLYLQGLGWIEHKARMVKRQAFGE